MSSTPDLDTGNPDSVLAARAGERLAHAYEQIASADEQLARVTEKLSRLEQDASRYPLAMPSRAPGRPVLRGLVGLALAACVGAAAYASRSPYGEATRLTIAQWAPFLLSNSSPWLTKPGNAAAPNPSTIQLASADVTAPRPGQPSPSPAQDAASTPAPIPPELTQLLQNMARDIATVQQGIEQLKASQQEMAAENARVIAELKAGQEQMTRIAARPPLQDPRPKTTPVPAPPAVATAAHKPPPPPPPPQQARARSQPVPLHPADQ